MTDKLQAYFDEARKLPPALTGEDVRALLAQKRVCVKRKWFNLKTTISMITLGACTLAVWLLVQNPCQQEPPALAQPETRHPGGQDAGVSLPAIASPRQEHTLEKLPEPAYAPAAADPMPGPPIVALAHRPLFFPSFPAYAAGSYFNQEGHLVLGQAELAALGIKTDGTMLEYLNITDSAHFVYTEADIPVSKRSCFSLSVSRNGGVFSSNDLMPDSLLTTPMKPFWPSVISHSSETGSHLIETERLWNTALLNEFFRLATPYLVPVSVETEGYFINTPKQNRFVFWFKADESFIRALPAAAQERIRASYPPSSLLEYTRLLDEYSLFGKWKYENHRFDSMLRNHLLKKAIEPGPALLKKLNITPTKEGAEYDNRVRQQGKVNTLRIIARNRYLETYYNDNPLKRWRLRPGDVPAMPVAVTSSLSVRPGYFYPGADSLTPLQQQQFSQRRFMHEAHQLVPVCFGEHYFLWFKPDEAFRRLINTPEALKAADSPASAHSILFSAEEVAALQSQYVNVSEEDLEKPGRSGPLAISNYDLTMISYPLSGRLSSDAEFAREAGWLVPVVTGENRQVKWFEPDEKLLETLALLQGHRRPDFSGVRFLDLAPADIARLGISQGPQGTRIPSVVNRKMVAYGVYSLSGSEHEIRLRPRKDTLPAAGFSSMITTTPHSEAGEEPDSLPEILYPTPVLITSSSGLMCYLHTLPGAGESLPDGMLKDRASMQERSRNNKTRIMLDLNSLIPVRVHAEDRYKGNRKHLDLIAWYEPDSLFLASIPYTKAMDIQSELDAIAGRRQPAGCYYFDACLNRPGTFQSFFAYPNPFYRNMKVNISLGEARAVTIALTGLDGKLVRTLWDKRACPAGTTLLSCSLPDIADGMYLLLITTDKEERIVQRVIRKRE